MNERLHKCIRAGLLIGVIPASVLLATGVALHILKPESSTVHIPLPGVLRGIPRMEPASFLSLGILCLYLTPVLAALAGAAVFAQQRDWRGAALTLAVLSIIALSICLSQR